MNGVEYHVRAVLHATGRGRAAGAMSRFAKQQARVAAVTKKASATQSTAWRKNALALSSVSQSVGRAGRGIENMGNRMSSSTLNTAKHLGKAAVAAGAIGGAYGIGKAITASVGLNEHLETAGLKMASTLQLMGWFKDKDFGKMGFDKAIQAQEQFNKNQLVTQHLLKAAKDIAIASPYTRTETIDFMDQAMPGLSAGTKNFDEIKSATEGLLPFSQYMESPKAAGAQISRILMGGAGSEFETWVKMRKAATVSAHDRGYKGYENIDGMNSEDMTTAWNKLSDRERFSLVGDIGDSLKGSLEAWRNSWVGMTSTMKSSAEDLQEAFGKTLFEKIKTNMRGGLDKFAPGTDLFGKLEAAAGTWGSLISIPVLKVLDWGLNALERVANNWEEYSRKILSAGQLMYIAAGLLVKLAVVRAGMGMGVQAAGKAVGAVGWMGELAGKLAGMGWVGLALGVVLGLLSVVVAGLVVALGGLAAWWIYHWDTIVQAFTDGKLNIEPLLQTLADLWAKFLAVGEAIMGTSDPITGATKGIGFLTESIKGLTDTMGWFLRAAGWVDTALNVVVGAFQTLMGASAALVGGLHFLISGVMSLIGKIPGASTLAPGLDAAVESSKHFTIGAAMWTAEGVTKLADPRSKLLDYADAFDAGKGNIELSDVSGWLTKALAEKIEVPGLGDLPKDTSDTNGKKNRPSGNTNVYINKVVNDLRNHDPDRIIGVFAKGVQRSVQKRVSANTNVRTGR